MPDEIRTPQLDGLRRRIKGEVLDDAFARGRYATDASIYQIMPHGVVVPRDAGDVEETLAFARANGLAVLPRGGGTSQCGQTVNSAIVIDTSKYMSRILELDAEGKRCVVEPGIVLDELNAQLKPHGLWFPVDVSTSSRATIGGMAGNNSCGGRSIRYGIMRDNILSVTAIMSDGSISTFGPVGARPIDGIDAVGAGGSNAKSSNGAATGVNGSNGEKATSANGTDTSSSTQGLLGEILPSLLEMGRNHEADIEAGFPKLLRRVGGYNVDALVPDAMAARPGGRNGDGINLAHLLVGSEGTLAFSTSIELKLSPLPASKLMGVCHFPSFYSAMDAAQHLVTLDPVAVELVDDTMIRLASELPIFQATIAETVRGEPQALLIVEFAEDDMEENRRRLAALHEMMAGLGFTWDAPAEKRGGVVDAIDPSMQQRIAEMRKSGLNIMMSMKQDAKPVSFVEDCSVALPDLAEYTAGLTRIFNAHGVSGTWYAHASVGCLHVRPVLDMKSDTGAKKMRAIAEEAFALVQRYGGSHSGEHGDGIVRSEFNQTMFGPVLPKLFAQIKSMFDPEGLFNPGRIVDAPKMDDRALFRYATGYAAKDFRTVLDWAGWPGAAGGLQGAVEMCNNNGACRKVTGGVMCPSYRATRNERDAVRGRANTLRLAMSGQLGDDAMTARGLAETMKLCVSCKACRAALRAREHGISIHDRLIAHLPAYAPVASRFALPLNILQGTWRHLPLVNWALSRLTGFTHKRSLPRWRRDAFGLRELPDTPAANDATGSAARESHAGNADAQKVAKRAASENHATGAGASAVPVALFVDTFNRYFEPENARAAVRVLRKAGYEVFAPTQQGGGAPCCGRTYLSSGMPDAARSRAQALVEAFHPFAKQGISIVGLEPSCTLALRDEIPVLLGSQEAREVGEATVTLGELLARDRPELGLPSDGTQPRVRLHGHCHQKSFDVLRHTQDVLGELAGVQVETVETSCCGMAGAFGYGRDTYDVSMKMAEIALLPAIRKTDADEVVVADGTSCRCQIADGAGREAVHLARYLDGLYRG